MLLSCQTYLDGRKEVVLNPVPRQVKWFWLRHFVFLNTLKVALYVWGVGVWGCAHACCSARVLFVFLCPLSSGSCIHCVLGLAVVINQAFSVRWTGVMSWSNCQASSCFAGKAKLFPEGMFFRNGRVCFAGPHRPYPVPGVLSPCRMMSFNASAWGAMEWSWKSVALLLLVCSSHKWSPHQVGNGLQTSHISWKKKKIPTSSVPLKLEGWGESQWKAGCCGERRNV